MYYLYIKAIHIVFIVTWFSGLFYITRLFIYNTEANELDHPGKDILKNQYTLMINRLWLGITWPSAILTMIFGGLVAYMYGSVPQWLEIKLLFVVLLYAYHFSLHKLYMEQKKGIFRFSSQQLRIWNEVATVLLVAIVFLASVKSGLSFLWGIFSLLVFIVVLLSAIKIYKILREKKSR